MTDNCVDANKGSKRVLLLRACLNTVYRVLLSSLCLLVFFHVQAMYKICSL